MDTYLKIIDFLETHIELVKVFLYGLCPVVGIFFKDIRDVIVKLLNGFYILAAMAVRSLLSARKRRKIFNGFRIEISNLPVSTQNLLFRFATEGQYIEITDIKANSRDILILHDKGWIHGLKYTIPYTICIDIQLLPIIKKIAKKNKK